MKPSCKNQDQYDTPIISHAHNKLGGGGEGQQACLLQSQDHPPSLFHELLADAAYHAPREQIEFVPPSRLARDGIDVLRASRQEVGHRAPRLVRDDESRAVIPRPPSLVGQAGVHHVQPAGGDVTQVEDAGTEGSRRPDPVAKQTRHAACDEVHPLPRFGVSEFEADDRVRQVPRRRRREHQARSVPVRPPSPHGDVQLVRRGSVHDSHVRFPHHAHPHGDAAKRQTAREVRSAVDRVDYPRAFAVRIVDGQYRSRSGRFLPYYAMRGKATRYLAYDVILVEYVDRRGEICGIALRGNAEIVGRILVLRGASGIEMADHVPPGFCWSVGNQMEKRKVGGEGGGGREDGGNCFFFENL